MEGGTSRIWAYERLIEVFETAKFGYLDINYVENKSSSKHFCKRLLMF